MLVRNSHLPMDRDLGLLKRDKALQRRYEAWSMNLKQKYTSNSACVTVQTSHRAEIIFPVDYLVNHRLQWGKPDRLSLLQSQIQDDPVDDEELSKDEKPPAYFTADMPRKFISIILNDWPYSGASSNQNDCHHLTNRSPQCHSM